MSGKLRRMVVATSSSEDSSSSDDEPAIPQDSSGAFKKQPVTSERKAAAPLRVRQPVALDSDSSSGDSSSDSDDSNAGAQAVTPPVVSEQAQIPEVKAAAPEPAVEEDAKTGRPEPPVLARRRLSSSSSSDGSDDEDAVPANAIGQFLQNNQQQKLVGGVDVNDPLYIREMESFHFDQIENPTHFPVAEEALPKIHSIRDQISRDHEIGHQKRDDFEIAADDVEVTIGSIPLNEAVEQERNIERLRARAINENESILRSELLRFEDMRKNKEKEISEQLRTRKTGLRERGQHKKEVLHADQEAQSTAFQESRFLLSETLEAEKDLVKRNFGQLKEGGLRNERSHLDWDKASRQIVITIDWLRALKDKLHAGKYVVMATLYSRLGGHPLRWAAIDSNHQHYGITSKPEKHGGKYYNLELNFSHDVNNRIFLACPSAHYTHPAMCIVFELFSIRTQFNAYDRVVAWGAFPLCNSQKEVIKGKYKVPLVRGPMRPFDKYSKIQKYMAEDIDRWLCNMYFTVSHWSRKINGVDEFETELDFTSKLLHLAERPIPADEDEPMDNGTAAVRSGGGLVASQDELASLVMGDDDAMYDSQFVRRNDAVSAKDLLSMLEDEGPIAAEFLNSDPDSDDAEGDSSMGTGVESKGLGRKMSMSRSRNSTIRRQSSVSRAISSLNAAEGKAKRTRAALGKLAAITTIPETTEEEVEEDEEDEIAATERLHDEQQQALADKKVRALRRYKTSLPNPESDVPPNLLIEKLTFIAGEVLQDYNGFASPQHWKTLDFWVAIVMLVVSFWLRMFVHYYGQFVYLTLSGVAVYDFTPHIITFDLLYPNDTVSILTQTVVVVMGPLSNIIVFIGFLMLAKMVQVIAQSFPDSASRFLLAYGIMTIMDPFIVLLIDALYENWKGDAFKLYHKFAEYGTGEYWGGVILTFMLLVILTFISCVLFYNYVTFLHMDGRMVDIYTRLTGDETVFFVPDDMEISLRVLKFILAKSKRFKGFHGGKRQVSVTKFTVKDHMDPDYEDHTLHISIYNVEKGETALERLEGRHIYRHFIRKHDGTIIELMEGEGTAEVEGYRAMEEKILSKTSIIQELENEAGDRERLRVARMKAMMAEQVAADLDDVSRETKRERKNRKKKKKKKKQRA